jgi:hypothetical protein
VFYTLTTVGCGDSHVTRDGEERCGMGRDELGQLWRAGTGEGDDTGAVLVEESADDGETDTSGASQLGRGRNGRDGTWMRR